MEPQSISSLIMMTRRRSCEVIIGVDDCEGRKEVDPGKPEREAAHPTRECGHVMPITTPFRPLSRLTGLKQESLLPASLTEFTSISKKVQPYLKMHEKKARLESS